MLNNLKIGIKLAIGFGITLAFLITIAVIANLRISALNHEVLIMGEDLSLIHI